MVNIKDIKRRRKSIENTMKITKAMELVAFSKLRKSKEQALETEPFFNNICEIITNVFGSNTDIDSAFVSKEKVNKRCYIVIAGDKGLAGSYNGNILRFALDKLKNYNKEDIFIISIGKKSINFFKRRNYKLYCQYSDISENPDINLISDISKNIIAGFLKDMFQEVYVVFTTNSS